MVSDDLLVLNNKDTLHTQKCGQIFKSFLQTLFQTQLLSSSSPASTQTRLAVFPQGFQQYFPR